jgi:AcrR family transcriptional regulator
MHMSDQSREDNRQRILAAAQDLFLRDGYDNFSIRKLAGRMDCAAGTLYLYFASKQELLLALANQNFKRLVRSLQDLSERHRNGDPVSLLKKVLYTYVQFARHNCANYQLAFRLHNSEHKDDSSLESAITILRSVVVRCIAEGRFRGHDPDVTTLALWAAVHGCASLPGGAPDPVVEQVVSNVVTGHITYTKAKAYGT